MSTPASSTETAMTGTPFSPAACSHKLRVTIKKLDFLSCFIVWNNFLFLFSFFLRKVPIFLSFCPHPTYTLAGENKQHQLFRDTASSQAQSKTPDIHSLRVSTEELLASLNDQTEDPDDPSFVLTPQCPSRDLFSGSPPGSQVFSRLSTKCHVHPFLFQIVSQGNAHLPPSRIKKTPHQGFWRSEVHVLCLRIRFVRKALAYVHGGVFGSSLLIWMCCFNDSHRPTLHTFLYVSFA
jgi:hypothetical protein